MISHSRARVFTLPALVLTGVVLFSLTGSRARADAWDKKTILTVDQPIQVRNTYLEPGTYVFKLLDSTSNRHVVQIFNSDQSHIIDTVMAIPNYRLQPTGDSRFAFWETPPGTAKALRAWFYPGDNFGQEFPYPKNPRQLEVAAVVSRTEPAPAPLVSNEPTEPENKVEEPVPAPTPTPAPAAQPSTENAPAPQQSTEPVTVAQNTPAPTPAPAAPESPQATPATNELPRTASPYTSLALIGLLSLISYGALRK